MTGSDPDDRTAGEPGGQGLAAEEEREEREERGGDPACWLRRVCQACGAMADEDPPTVCPACHAYMPVI